LSDPVGHHQLLNKAEDNRWRNQGVGKRPREFGALLQEAKEHE